MSKINKLLKLLLVASIFLSQSASVWAFDSKTVCKAAKNACKGTLVNQGGEKDIWGNDYNSYYNFTGATNIITRNYGTATVYVNCQHLQNGHTITAEGKRFSSTSGLGCKGKTCHNNKNWGTMVFADKCP